MNTPILNQDNSVSQLILDKAIRVADSVQNDDQKEAAIGLILSLPDYRILCQPFDRFYNWGEGDTGKGVDLTGMIGLSKEDGSCLSVYHDGKEWCVSTRKMAFAEGNTITGKTYYELFLDAFGHLETKMRDFPKGFTYIFEFCSPDNRVVKRYREPKVYLLGIRSIYTGWYCSYNVLAEIAQIMGVSVPERYFFRNYKEIEQAIKEIDATDSLDEGFVLWNEETGYRIKIKSPKYVAYHHLRNNGDLNPKNIVKLVFSNEHHEYLSIYPEDTKHFQPWICSHTKLLEAIEKTYEKFKDIGNQKEFALSIKDLPIRSILFRLRRGDRLQDCLESMHIKQKVQLLEAFKGD